MYNIVVTSGGTEEKIDEVRRITNNATGKLGSIISNKLIETNEVKVFYICSKTAIRPNLSSNIDIIEIDGVNNLKSVIENILTTNKIDIFIHTMAVSDYIVDYVSDSSKLSDYIIENYNFFNLYNKNKDSFIKEKNILEKLIIENKNIIDNSKKISSSEENLIIKLRKAPKVISLIKELSPDTKLIGFKLLNQVEEKELLAVSQRLLEKNKCDLVIGNDSKSFINGKHNAIFVNSRGIIDRAQNKEEIADKLVKFLNIK